MVAFTDLFFGRADAANEVREFPREFVQSFVDHHRVVEALTTGSKYLLLGPKGSGKSAVAHYVKETAVHRGTLVSTRDISELPLAEVGSLKTGEANSPGRVVTAWRFIVLCALLDVVMEDQSCPLNRDPDVLRVVKELRSFGFMDPTPARAILTASRKTLKIPIPKVGEVFSRESETSLHLYHLVPYIEQWVGAGRTDNAYRLFLDGLDSIYLNDPSYPPTLSALVQAVYLVNQRLTTKDARVVLLVRNDVFSRLRLPDAGKMRVDFGVDLDWRALSGDPKNAPLFDMVNKKAGALLREEIDVVSQFLPEEVKLRGETRMPIRQYMLNLTRHTPRDLLQLFENLRLAAIDLGGANSSALSQNIVREGALRYANRYFVDAIRNELVGRSSDEYEATAGLDALRDMGKTHFVAEDFARERFGDRPSREDQVRANELLRWFFFAGAIGNVKAGQRESYLQFFHRRDDSDVYVKGPLTLHTALTYAWAVPRGGLPGRRARWPESGNEPKSAVAGQRPRRPRSGTPQRRRGASGSRET